MTVENTDIAFALQTADLPNYFEIICVVSGKSLQLFHNSIPGCYDSRMPFASLSCFPDLFEQGGLEALFIQPPRFLLIAFMKWASFTWIVH